MGSGYDGNGNRLQPPESHESRIAGDTNAYTRVRLDFGHVLVVWTCPDDPLLL